MTELGFIQHDGGRAAAGFRGEAGDCVTRAIALATGEPYLDVYKALADLCAATGRARTPRDGVPRKVYDRYLLDLGWHWTPTMLIGSGCSAHLRADDLPTGRLIARLSGHLVAVLAGIVYDTSDPRRGGTRCVYGYWSKP